jgi:DNA-directed RNA polymerase specialized sigma24 family protein
MKNKLYELYEVYGLSINKAAKSVGIGSSNAKKIMRRRKAELKKMKSHKVAANRCPET